MRQVQAHNALPCDHTRIHTRHMSASLERTRTCKREGRLTPIVTPPVPNMAKFYARWVKHAPTPTPLTLLSSLRVKELTRRLKCTWHLDLYIGETTSGLKFILVGPVCHKALVNEEQNRRMAEIWTYTCVIRPKSVADDDRRRCGAIPVDPLAFNVLWSNSNSVEAFESQYAKTSLLSCVWISQKKKDIMMLEHQCR